MLTIIEIEMMDKKSRCMERVFVVLFKN